MEPAEHRGRQGHPGAWPGGRTAPSASSLLRGADAAERALVGTPERVADSIAQWFTQRAADGFNLNFDAFPSGLEHIADHLVPELQRRGIFRKEYESATLRGHSAPTGVERPGSGVTVVRVGC